MPANTSSNTSNTNTSNTGRERSGERSASDRPYTNRPSSGATESSGSGDEIRETVKEAVGKGVSAVAGVAEGINEKMEETELPDQAERAVRQVGETANKVVKAAREETDNLKKNFKGEGEEEEEEDETSIDPTFSSGGQSPSASSSSGSSWQPGQTR